MAVSKTVHLDTQVGRRMSFRDLQIFAVVVQTGSMAKAARRLGMKQPSISKTIRALEAELGVRLFDRGTNGVVANAFGEALIKCSAAVFDDLRQGVRSLEFLADPTQGELRIGCVAGVPQMMFFSVAIERFREKYPRVLLNIDEFPSRSDSLDAIRERRCDLGFFRIPDSSHGEDDISVDVLFDDRMVIVSGLSHRLARRRSVDLTELVNEPWIMSTTDPQSHEPLMKAFQARGLPLPKPALLTMSVPLRLQLLTTGRFVAPLLESMLPLAIAQNQAIKELPVKMSPNSWPMTMVTLRRRMQVPIADRFIQIVRAAVA